MKRLLNVLILTLAVNFLAVAGGVGWLYQSGRLDKQKLHSMKEIVFPQPTNAPGAEAATQPSDGDPATNQPMLKLEELLAQHAGRPPGEQVEFIQSSFDAQMAQLDRKQRELNDLARQVEIAKQQAARDRDVLAKNQTDLTTREKLSTKLASDKGFQDSLKLYTSMPPKQVKTVFMTLDDETMQNYLQAMQPRQATKIIKEFKSLEETARVQKVLEQMRLAQPEATPAAGKRGPAASTAEKP